MINVQMTNVIFVADELLDAFLPWDIGDDLLDARTTAWFGFIGFKVDCGELVGSFFGELGGVAVVVGCRTREKNL